MEKAAIFGHFSGDERAKGDTTNRRGDTKDRCGSRGRETEAERDRHRNQDSRDHRGLVDRRNSALPCDDIEAYSDKKKPIREAYADRRVRERCQTR
jgi:hypothetical protein